MTRVAALVAALVLCGVPVLTTPLRPVAAGAGIALLLAVGGVVTLRRWPATAAACAAVATYGLALWLSDARLSPVAAMAFGLALVLLLQALEIARCRRAAIDVGVTRSQLGGWLAFGIVVPGIVIFTLGVSAVLASSVPLLVAPLLAAAGALGLLLGLASALTRTNRDSP